MKIGFDAKRLFANLSGLGSYSRNLIHNLALFYPKHQYHLYSTKINEKLDLNDILSNPHVTHTISNHFFKTLWRTYTITKSLKKNHVDLYHGLSHEIPRNIKYSGIKSIVTIHDLIFKTHPHLFTFIDRTIYGWKVRNSIQNADKIIAISQNTKRDIVNFYHTNPQKIEVIYQPCNLSFYQPFNEAKKQAVKKKYSLPNDYLLFVGNVEKRKNIEVILRAIPQLGLHKSIPFVIVGKGKSYKNNILQLANNLNISNQLITLDNLQDTDELVHIYRNASIFVYPSLYEGFGIPVVEALLSKVPVITSKNSALKESGGNAARYIAPTNHQELASEIIHILENQEKRTQMIQSGLQYATEKFDRKKTTQQVMKTYIEVLS